MRSPMELPPARNSRLRQQMPLGAHVEPARPADSPTWCAVRPQTTCAEPHDQGSPPLPIPPLQHAQRAERVPAARRPDAFQLKVRLSFVRNADSDHRPSSPTTGTNDVDRVGEARVAGRIDLLEMVECAQDVVVPSRREDKSREVGLDDVPGPVRPEEAVREQELPSAALRGTQRRSGQPSRCSSRRRKPSSTLMVVCIDA